MGSRAWLKKLFSWGGFFTLRLRFPVEYLLLRELSDHRSVLDLGCGPHSMIAILPSHIRKVGVELHEPYYRETLSKGRHHETIQTDLNHVEFEENSFDAVVLLDVIEHLTKEEGNALIQKMQRWARKKVIVYTPNGFVHQDEYDENPLQKHRSGWIVEEMLAKGFKVYGVNGFKALKKDSHDHDSPKKNLWEHLVDLTQIVTYHFPKHAFQMFCVMEIAGEEGWGQADRRNSPAGEVGVNSSNI